MNPTSQIKTGVVIHESVNTLTSFIEELKQKVNDYRAEFENEYETFKLIIKSIGDPKITSRYALKFDKISNIYDRKIKFLNKSMKIITNDYSKVMEMATDIISLKTEYCSLMKKYKQQNNLDPEKRFNLSQSAAKAFDKYNKKVIDFNTSVENFSNLRAHLTKNILMYKSLDGKKLIEFSHDDEMAELRRLTEADDFLKVSMSMTRYPQYSFRDALIGVADASVLQNIKMEVTEDEGDGNSEAEGTTSSDGTRPLGARSSNDRPSGANSSEGDATGPFSTNAGPRSSGTTSSSTRSSNGTRPLAARSSSARSSSAKSSEGDTTRPLSTNSGPRSSGTTSSSTRSSNGTRPLGATSSNDRPSGAESSVGDATGPLSTNAGPRSSGTTSSSTRSSNGTRPLAASSSNDRPPGANSSEGDATGPLSTNAGPRSSGTSSSSTRSSKVTRPLTPKSIVARLSRVKSSNAYGSRPSGARSSNADEPGPSASTSYIPQIFRPPPPTSLKDLVTIPPGQASPVTPIIPINTPTHSGPLPFIKKLHTIGRNDWRSVPNKPVISLQLLLQIVRMLYDEVNGSYQKLIGPMGEPYTPDEVQSRCETSEVAYGGWDEAKQSVLVPFWNQIWNSVKPNDVQNLFVLTLKLRMIGIPKYEKTLIAQTNNPLSAVRDLEVRDPKIKELQVEYLSLGVILLFLEMHYCRIEFARAGEGRKKSLGSKFNGMRECFGDVVKKIEELLK